jgi:N-acetylglucosamine-6-phosphate deacetylase
MLDIQVNGGGGFLFNDIKNLDEFLIIEKAHFDNGSFIIPTFITDNLENLKRFINIVIERIKLNTYPLFGIHIEGFFITNKGTHPEEYLLSFNEKNINKIIKILEPVKNIPICFTLAPELIKNIDLFIKFKRNFKNITIAAGHTKITKNDFKDLQNKLGDERINMLTHFHNAMLGGHTIDEGIPAYVFEYGFDGYIGMITDGHHTKQELLPTLSKFKNICIVSDASAPACKNDIIGKEFIMGGHKATVEQKKDELPCFYWIAENGYKTLAGSAVCLKQCRDFLQNKYPKYLDKKMFLENQIKALNISKEIYKYLILLK